MKSAVKALRKHNVQVVGLQELQPTQKGLLRRQVGRGWGIYSGSPMTGNSIAWSKKTFKLVRGDTIAIPYFDGRLRPMPYVALRTR